MEMWAQEMKGQVHFLTVSVAGEQLARTFNKQYTLKNVVNGFVARQEDMPTSGQLGCQGFIVLDKAGQVYIPKSLAFLDKGEAAFRDVEFQLKCLLAEDSAHPLLNKGEKVSLTRLYRTPAFNGKSGVVSGYCSEKARYEIMLNGSERVLRVRSRNLRPWSKQRPSFAASGGCANGACGIPTASVSCGEKSSESGQCGNGACGSAPCDSKQARARDSKDASAASEIELPSVGVVSLDKEHAACADLLKELRTEGQLETLVELLEEMSEHFKHEEDLFADHKFGEHGTRFSATKTHCLDHELILSMATKEIARCRKAKESRVRDGFAEELATRLVKHTEQYDTLYADFMEKRGVK